MSAGAKFIPPKFTSNSCLPVRVNNDRHLIQKAPLVPAFLKSEYRQVYEEYRLYRDICIDGFTFGTITKLSTKIELKRGDAFLVASDGSRCGLCWQFRADATPEDIRVLIEPEPFRWGVFWVTFPHPIQSKDDVRRNLAFVVPFLKPFWQQWLSDLAVDKFIEKYCECCGEECENADDVRSLKSAKSLDKSLARSLESLITCDSSFC